MDAKEWIGLLAVAVTGSTFAAGLWQFVKAQRWKRAEFVAGQIREFESAIGVRNAMVMLDWHTGEIEPLQKDGVRLRYTNAALEAALIPETEKPGYNEVEAAIVDSFGQFFDGLERFNHFVETGLLKAYDLRPYLIYRVEAIADERKSRKPARLRQKIWRYIDSYGYSGVQELFRKLRYDIVVSKGQ